MKVRIGVIGGGLIAQVAHLPYLTELQDRFELVALAEPSRKVREALSWKYRIPRTYADFRALIQDASVDAVLICSPNGTHAEAVLAALRARLHVFVEKPLCITLADADRIIAERDRAGTVVQVGYMKRYDRAYAAMIEDLPELGGESLEYISVVTHDPGLPRFFAPAGVPAPDDVSETVIGATRQSLAEQVAEAVGSDDPEVARQFSDVFLGALVHDVNLCHGLFERLGEPPPRRVLDAASWPRGAGATLALESGGRWVITWLHLPGLHHFRERVELFSAGAVRSLTFPAPYLKHASAVYELESGTDQAHSARRVGSYSESFAQELLRFHRCILDGDPCLTPPEQARVDIELLSDMFHAVREAAVLEGVMSAEHGRTERVR